MQVKEKLIEKLKYVATREFCHPKKAQNLQKIKRRKIKKGQTLQLRVCENNCVNGYGKEKTYILKVW